MPWEIYETDEKGEPTEPNEVRVSLAWLFSSTGKLDFEDSRWTLDLSGSNAAFVDEENETRAEIPSGTDGDIAGGSSTEDTRVDVSDDGNSVATDAAGINFADLLSASDPDGDGTVDVSGTDTHIAVSSETSEVLADIDDLNFGTEFSVSDDGDNSATVTTNDDVIRTRQATIPLTEIADGNTAVGLRKQIPSGKTLRVLEVGVEDDSGAAPSGLTIEVQDLTNATTIVSQNARHAEGSPLNSKSGAIDVAFRVSNATGGSVNASGYVLYTME